MKVKKCLIQNTVTKMTTVKNLKNAKTTDAKQFIMILRISINNKMLSVWFANGLVVLVIAALLYTLLTNSLNVGTPLADSLTQQQKAIKAASAQTRGRIYAIALTAAAGAVLVWRPF